jgi:predicted Zn-dependent peptidase
LVSTAGLDPKRVEEGISVIVEQYAKIASSKSGISKDEIKKAKEYLKGHFVLELEDSRAVAGYFAQTEILEKKIETPEEIIAKIEAVTIEDVEKVAQKYFKQEQLNMAIIGNFPSTGSGQVSARQRFEKLLKF